MLTCFFLFRKLSEFRRCILRVQFPDRHIVQCVFLSGETVAQVKSFLAETVLSDGEKPFDLFITPPKTVLQESDTLLDAGCVPSAVVHVAGQCQIRDSVLEKKSNLPGAQSALREAALKRRQEQQGTSKEEAPSMERASSSVPALERSPPAQQMKTVPDAKSGSKVPKWFKSGKQ